MELPSTIFKLNLDCFVHVFDYLALEDLRQFSQTCQSMKAAVGQYYQANYGTKQELAMFGKKNLCLACNTIGYSDLVQKLCIYPDIYTPEEDIDTIVKWDFSRKVMEIQIRVAAFTKPELNRLEYIINNAEILNIGCRRRGMSDTFNDTVPSMCNSLKRLHMRDFQYENAARTQDGNRWLLRDYPTLEHLEWTQHHNHGYKINDIKTFFERNPNVRSFATNVDCLWKSRRLIIESGIKLDDLTIEIDQERYENSPKMIQKAYILLNELYEKSVYKQLHLKFTNMYGQQTIQQIDQIIPINAVRSLSLPRSCNINSTKLVNLVELQFKYDGHSRTRQDADVMAIALSYLVNLERVDLGLASLDVMLPFIYHTVKLKKLRLYRFCERNVSALDLANMNERREQLLDATKVTIFIEEEFYLVTKWALKSTDFPLIEMKRSTAHEWSHHFGQF